MNRNVFYTVLALAFATGCFLLVRDARAETRDLSVGSHDVQVGDIRLHYVVAGHGPLVFVISPGWGIGSVYLQKGFVPLEAELTLVFLDERGNGGSSRPMDSKKMGTVAMADDLEGLRKFLGLRVINMLGHSQGGTIALDYAERYPNRVDKLALIDPEVMDDHAQEKTQAILAALKNDPLYTAAVEVALHGPTVVDDVSFASTMDLLLPLYFSDPQRQVPLFKTTLQGTHLSSFAQNAIQPADLREPRPQSREYGRVRADTLIVSGELDWYCPIEVSRRMRTGISDSSLIEYRGVGHFPWIEEPKRFFLDIEGFFEPSRAIHE